MYLLVEKTLMVMVCWTDFIYSLCEEYLIISATGLFSFTNLYIYSV